MFSIIKKLLILGIVFFGFYFFGDIRINDVNIRDKLQELVPPENFAFIRDTILDQLDPKKNTKSALEQAQDDSSKLSQDIMQTAKGVIDAMPMNKLEVLEKSGKALSVEDRKKLIRTLQESLGH